MNEDRTPYIGLTPTGCTGSFDPENKKRTPKVTSS